MPIKTVRTVAAACTWHWPRRKTGAIALPPRAVRIQKPPTRPPTTPRLPGPNTSLALQVNLAKDPAQRDHRKARLPILLSFRSVESEGRFMKSCLRMVPSGQPASPSPFCRDPRHFQQCPPPKTPPASTGRLGRSARADSRLKLYSPRRQSAHRSLEAEVGRS